MSAPSVEQAATTPFPPKDYAPNECPRCGASLSRGCAHMVKVRAMPRAGLGESR